jgi:16S rRNA (guanine1516-N2)-methyltransferase
MRRAPAIAVLLDDADSAQHPRARALARRLVLPLIESPAVAEVEYVLGFDGERLELRQASDRPGRGIAAEFSSIDLRRGSASLSKRQPLARAIGSRARTIVDATAGLGHDSALLAAMGFEVMAIERSPVIAALLETGLEWARRATAFRDAIAGRLQLLVGDAREILPALRPTPDVVYIDAMFPPKRKSSALAKKSIRLVRAMVGDDDDAAELVFVARAHARQRVVVKRPTEAEPLAGTPTMSHSGKLVRYDVYVSKAPEHV